MANTIITINHVSKRFFIGERQPYYSLRDSISSIFGKKSRISLDTFWALNDVSFNINQGDTIGIIGKNGAGKSTLLKILSRITPPTRGEITIHGRIASLLEVGTGFHPELTGRENIYLNGAILGMKKKEIEEKFNEIVKFAEVEKFIDTPVKHFSSGMYLRLAFAVAAHLEPEILIIDEVLAVGDIQFQKKCLGKMDSIANTGRTLLFVSHDMGAILKICKKVVWLDKGRVMEYGKAESVVKHYIQTVNTQGVLSGHKSFTPDKNKEFQITEVNLTNHAGRITTSFSCDEEVRLGLSLTINKIIPDVYGYLEVRSDDNQKILVSDSYDGGSNVFDLLPPGHHRVGISIPSRTLAPGKYTVYLNFASSFSVKTHSVDSPGLVAQFHLIDYTTRRGNNRGGYFSTILNWELISK